MHNIIKIFLAFISAALLFGCSTAHLTYIDKSYKTDTVTVELQIPQFCSLKDEEFQNTINSEIQDTCNEFLNKFKTSTRDFPYPSVFTCDTNLHENGKVLSLVTQIDYYTKKPHNNSFRITKNINKETSTEISLGDLFPEESYIDLINSKLTEIVRANPQEYSDLWAKPRLLENQAFYLTNENLVIYYPPYELSYYSRGFVEFSIPLTELSGYLTEEYRQILTEKQRTENYSVRCFDFASK